jgi:two-component system sensor histidine kinase TctE
VRDASHQLRTPLAVLKTQLQSALRGDVEPTQALHEMNHTVTRATELGEPDARARQGRATAPARRCAGHRLGAVTRAVALDLAPLVAEHRLDFSIDTGAVRRALPTSGRCANWRAT